LALTQMKIFFYRELQFFCFKTHIAHISHAMTLSD
jgi:hypothetical protein